MVYFETASITSNPCSTTPSTRPPAKFTTLIISPAVASPLTYLVAPSMAPKNDDSACILSRLFLASSSSIAPVFKSASIAICLPGIASSVNLAVTSDTRSEPLLITTNCTITRIINIIIPITRLPPPTNCPKVSTTLPAYPVRRIFLVELTLSDILKRVVISSSVGNDDIATASFEKSALNKIIRATLILNKISISSSTVGIGTIRNTTGNNIYNPRNKSCFFILQSAFLYNICS